MEAPPARVRPPLIVVAVMAFQAYAAFVALPFLVLGQPSAKILTALLVTGSLATLLALCLRSRWWVTFHLTRGTLALWAGCGVYSAVRMIAVPWFAASVRPQPALIQIIMVVGVTGICSLFYLYGFGRRSRAFYGRAATSTPR